MRILLAISLALFTVSAAPPSQSTPKPAFSLAALSSAKALSSFPSGVELQQSGTSGPNLATSYAADAHNPNPITVVYAGTIEANYPDIAITGDAYAAGVLAVLLLHEKEHFCLGVPPRGSARKNKYSCEHLAIDQSARDASCVLAGELKDCVDNVSPPPGVDPPASGDIGNTGPERQDCEDTLVGVCEALKQMQDKWNNAARIAGVRKCCNGTANPNFTPNPACPGVKIPKDSAGGCNYNDNVVISDCDTCDEYLE